MKFSTFFSAAIAVAVAVLVASGDAQTVPPGAKKPCLTAGGVAINLNGNFGFCYLKGRRMRPGSIFGQCKDGKLTCFEDEGIPDKPRKSVPCIAPEPGSGNCGSDKNATPAPTTTNSTATPRPSAGNGTRSMDPEVGDDDDHDDEEDEEEEGGAELEDGEMRSMPSTKHTVNPSALVAGNLPSGETYDDEDDTEEDDGTYR